MTRHKRELVLWIAIAVAALMAFAEDGKAEIVKFGSDAYFKLLRDRPEIAPYPFTTKYPNLGRVQVDFERSFILADIPGLIEGAHAGAGLGHEFLRHIQRAGILVHLVEPAPLDGTNPAANYRAIREELERYDPGLGQRPEIVAVTKADLPEAVAARDELAAMLSRPVHLVSAVTGQGLNTLLGAVVSTLKEDDEG